MPWRGAVATGLAAGHTAGADGRIERFATAGLVVLKKDRQVMLGRRHGIPGRGEVPDPGAGRITHQSPGARRRAVHRQRDQGHPGLATPGAADLGRADTGKAMGAAPFPLIGRGRWVWIGASTQAWTRTWTRTWIRGRARTLSWGWLAQGLSPPLA